MAAAEGVEHLQAAAHELIASARSFLDVAEIAIENPDVVPQVFALLAKLANVDPIAEDPPQDNDADASEAHSQDNVVKMKGA